MEANLKKLELDKGMRRNVKFAETANTGLDYLDSLSQELVDTAYLHNHSRMWFVSIRIFTLNLPRGLGADFFCDICWTGIWPPTHWVSGGLLAFIKGVGPTMLRIGILPNSPISDLSCAEAIYQISLRF